MTIIVFGANGKVGNRVVETLLNRGHTVIAFVHTKHNPQERKNLTFYTGDVKNQHDVTTAMRGADAVISALGSWGTPTKDIVSSGMRTIIPAMQQHGIRRIVSLTGSGATAPGDHLGIIGKLSHQLFGLVAHKILEDGEKHIALLAASDRSWTVIRSPVMKNSGNLEYVLTNKLPGMFETINRQAVANAMADQLENTHFINKAPHIHQG